MRTSREIPEKFYPENFDASRLRKVIEGSLVSGHDIEITAWSEEYAKEDEGVNWRIHAERVPFREIRGRVDKGSIDKVFADFEKYSKRHCVPPVVTGLPKTDDEWEEFAANFRYVFLSGLQAGISVEFRAYIPGSNRRGFSRFADLDFEFGAKDTLYHFGWDESSGSSETTWLESTSTHMMRALSKAADKVEATLDAMDAENDRLAAIAERRRQIMLARKAKAEAEALAKS